MISRLSRHGRSKVGFLLAAFAISSCGGVAEETPGGTDAGQRRESGRDAAAADRTDATDGPNDSSDGDSALPAYVEDACPPSTPDPPSYECDPFDPKPAQCPAGYACYPYPPQGTDPCHPGSWGSKCRVAGTGIQGSACNGGARSCAGGYVCVKSGAGDQCV
jgi:hypothetical protein